MTGPVHTVTFVYEPGRNAMTQVENKETVGTASVVSNYAYTYNALGQRADREQSGTAFATTNKDTFTYDYLGQVTASSNDTRTGDAWHPSYAYDAIGNRTGDTVDLNGTTVYTPDLLNQYDLVGSTTPTYDADGNLTSDGAWTYSWNGENRLINADNGTVSIDFEYDYQGRLVEKNDGTNVIVYLYDGWNRIATFVNGSHSTSYLWGADLSGSMQGAGGVGGLLKEGNRYPTFDANGNIVQKLDSNGGTDMAVAYDPFGNVIEGVLVGEYGFSTKPLVDLLDFYYYGFRYYDPVTGRWPSRDPIEEEGGLNLYGMVGNDPLNAWDYLGQDWTYSSATDQVQSTIDNWASSYPFASNLMEHWLNENVNRGSDPMPDYEPTQSDIDEVRDNGIDNIDNNILSVLRSNNNPSSYTSTQPLDVDYYPFVDGKLFRAYGGVRIDFSSDEITYRKQRRATVGFSGTFELTFTDTYAWPARWEEIFSPTYRAARYLQDECDFQPMSHELTLSYDF